MTAKLNIDVNFVTEAYASGLSAVEISRQLGCSAGTILNTLVKVGVPRRDSRDRQTGKPTKKRMEQSREREVLEVYFTGKTTQECASIIGCSSGTVRNVLIRNGVTPRSGGEARLGKKMRKRRRCCRCLQRKLKDEFTKHLEWCDQCFELKQARRFVFVDSDGKKKKLCRHCNKVKDIEHFARRAEKTYRQPCVDCRQEYSREHCLRYLYGMSMQQYDAMLESHGGCCAICRTDRPGAKGKFMVDHDHSTGAIRGLLCCRCNFGLGTFKDDPSILESAIRYLAKETE